jgi:hypothetical protein
MTTRINCAWKTKLSFSKSATSAVNQFSQVRRNFIEKKRKTEATQAYTLDQCKVFPVHVMKAYRGSRGTTPLILNLSTIRRWLTWRSDRFTSGKEAWCLMNRRLGGHQRRGRCGKQKNPSPLPGLEPRTVAQSLHWLRYLDSQCLNVLSSNLFAT